MNNNKIIFTNREIKLNPNACYFVKQSGLLFPADKKFLTLLISTFDEQRRNNGNTIESLKENVIKVISRNKPKTRVLENTNAGYVMLGGLTVVGIIGVSIIIFMAINMILNG